MTVWSRFVSSEAAPGPRTMVACRCNCSTEAGQLAETGPSTAAAMASALSLALRHDTTSCVLSFVTDSVDAMAERLT